MNRKRMLTRVSLILLIGFALLLPTSPANAQESIVSGWSYAQSFGTDPSAIVPLPSNWRIDKATSVRSVGTWAAAGTVTELRAGDDMSSVATNGIYNYGAGPAATATDRAIGWVSSGSATKSGNLYLYLRNNAPTNSLGKVTVSYDVEKYRSGSNSAGFAVQLYYSTDGSTWTSAGSNFLTTFSADADNAGFANAPGATQTVSNQVLTLATPIAPGGSLYLAWNYSVMSGSTSTNAQGLGIDNVSLGSPLQPTAITLRGLSASSGGTALPVMGLALAGLLVGAVVVRRK